MISQGSFLLPDLLEGQGLELFATVVLYLIMEVEVLSRVEDSPDLGTRAMDQLQVDGVLVVGKLFWSIERSDDGTGWAVGDDRSQGEYLIVVVLGAALVDQGYDRKVLGIGARETGVPAGV